MLDNIGGHSPERVNGMQLRFGFEGVAGWNGDVSLAFQRARGVEE